MKTILTKYGMEKLGLHNGKTKKCICGTEMSIDEKNCPNCNEKLNKTSLLNVAKNGALGKRFEESIEGDVITLRYYHLLSNAFDLYETNMFEITIDKSNAEIRFSDPKMFKSLSEKDDLINFFDKHLPGFIKYVKDGLSCFRYEFAVSNFGSLSSNQLSNFLNIYLNYKALDKHLLGYKVFYYGSKVNLKRYYPTTDFTKKEEVEKTDLFLPLLKTWDIKNERYIETIIEISKTATKEQLEMLENIITEMTIEASRGYRSEIEYNDIIETFGLLYNQDISLENFIRIRNNSTDKYFCQFNTFKQNYKKCISRTIDWDSIDGLDRKTLGTLAVKTDLLKSKKLDKKSMETVYETLDKDPLAALKQMTGFISKK